MRGTRAHTESGMRGRCVTGTAVDHTAGNVKWNHLKYRVHACVRMHASILPFSQPPSPAWPSATSKKPVLYFPSVNVFTLVFIARRISASAISCFCKGYACMRARARRYAKARAQRRHAIDHPGPGCAHHACARVSYVCVQ